MTMKLSMQHPTFFLFHPVANHGSDSETHFNIYVSTNSRVQNMLHTEVDIDDVHVIDNKIVYVLTNCKINSIAIWRVSSTHVRTGQYEEIIYLPVHGPSNRSS